MSDSAYEDIINLPHHVSDHHPQMPPENRAAQFAPFSALTGYEEVIEETERLTQAEVELSEDAAEELNEKLTALRALLAEKPQVKADVTYFDPDPYKAGGTYRTISDAVARIDTYRHVILMRSGAKIPISSITELAWDIE